jgi:hypothetical protein
MPSLARTMVEGDGRIRTPIWPCRTLESPFPNREEIPVVAIVLIILSLLADLKQ